MNMTPAEALRLSRAYTLAEKHGEPAVAAQAGDPPRSVWTLTVEQVAALIDEATAAKDKTIATLRQEVKDASAEARDAYHEGVATEADRHSEQNHW